MAMTLFTKLDEEWAWLARSKRKAETLRGWAEAHPVLSPFADLHDLIEFVQRRNQAVAASPRTTNSTNAIRIGDIYGKRYNMGRGL